jgi:transcription initiation factor TFIIIB Brf1 subunit/transcription initiation factor TFIIB
MPSQLVCPNCGSRKIGKEHGEKEYYCDACTEFFAEPKEIITEEKSNKQVEKKEMAVKGKCVNCLRDGMSLPAGHMCGGCNARVKGFKSGSPEYIAALAKAKKDFNDPDYKSGRGGKRKKEKLPVVPDHLRKGASQKRGQGQNPCSPPTSDYAVISTLCAQRDFHLAQADKLQQAIELLS